MKYPSIEAGIEFANPINGYINFFAAHDIHGRMYERRDKRLNGTCPPVERAGRLIGQACLSLTGRPNPHQAKSRFRQAKDEIRRLDDRKQQDNMQRHQRDMLWHIASMLDMRNQPSSVNQAREAMHTTTITSLKRAKQKMKQVTNNGIKSRLSGFISETATLALLTRYKHPWLLALPALDHHDRSDNSASNFDMVLIEGGPAFPEPVSHKIQIKRECIGLCGEYSDGPVKFAKQYNHDICLVSGCCDLGITPLEDGKYDFSTVTLLTKEFGDSATSGEISQLDQLTNDLLFSITSDPRRYGLVTPRYE